MKTSQNQKSNSELNPAQSQSANHMGNRRVRRGRFSRINFAQRRSNQRMTTEQLLSVLQREAPRFWQLSMVVGEWMWVQFSEPQPKRVTVLLSQLGFWWSKRRQCWQHPCGVFSENISTGDPREHYGCLYPAQFRNF